MRPGGIRRPLRPPVPPPSGAPDRLRQELTHANRLMEQGKPLEAAPIFERLSRLVEGRAPIRAANLAARAAQAYLLGENADLALEQIRRALRLRLDANDLSGAVQLVHRALADLKAHGYEVQAAALREQADAVLSRYGLSLSDSAPQTPAVPTSVELPTQCPHCGGPVHPGEVEWVSETRVRCAYCGSILAGEG